MDRNEGGRLQVAGDPVPEPGRHVDDAGRAGGVLQQRARLGEGLVGLRPVSRRGSDGAAVEAGHGLHRCRHHVRPAPRCIPPGPSGRPRPATRSSTEQRQGVRHLVFVNGHYENCQFLYEGIDLALEECGIGPDADRSVLLLSYWDFVTEETLAEFYPEGFPGWEIEHGGVLETSLMLHLEPARVDLDRSPSGPPASLPRFDRLPVVASRTLESGCLSSPQGPAALRTGGRGHRGRHGGGAFAAGCRAPVIPRR